MNRNKTFKINLPSKVPYYYVSAQLDISGAKNGDTFYFNLDNDFQYLDNLNQNYHRYIQITDQSIIGDVIVYTDPIVVTTAETANGPIYTIGGAQDTSSPVVVPYAAPSLFGPKLPPQFSGSSLRTNELNAKPINYFGHSAAKFPYGQDNSGHSDTNTNYKFLAITFSSPDVPIRSVLVVSGIVYVILKVYPK